MSELIREPSDAEFSALLDARAPSRLKDPETWEPENVTTPAEEPVPVAPEDGLVPEEPVAPVAPVDPKYADKTTEELIEMHRNAEQLIGRQGQQLGDYAQLKSQVDQLQGALAERESYTPQQPLTQETVDWVEEAIVGNPRETMAWVEANQPALKDRALQTWANIDPYGASQYSTQRLLAEQRAQFNQELAAVRAPVIAQQTDKQLETAYRTVSTTLPGFDEVAGDLPALLEANPELKVALVGGDISQKQRILENLGKMAFANRALAQNATPAAPTAPVIDPRVAASVTSGLSSGEHEETTRTPAETLKATLLASGPTSIQDELARSRAKAR